MSKMNKVTHFYPSWLKNTSKTLCNYDVTKRVRTSCTIDPVTCKKCKVKIDKMIKDKTIFPDEVM